MKAKHENPFDTLAELELNSPSEPDLISEKEVFAELRFSEDEVDVGGYDIQVSLVKATLHLHAWGSTVSPGTRLAEKSKLSHSYTATSRKLATANRAIGKGGIVEGNSLGLFSGNAERRDTTEHGDEEEIEITQELTNRYVRSTSGNRWIITEDDNGDTPLTDVYIANELLCKVMPNEKTNAVSVYGVIVIRKSDILVDVRGNKLQQEYRKRLHKNKFHAAIIAKCLSEYTGQTDNEKCRGRLIVSRSKLETDPDVS